MDIGKFAPDWAKQAFEDMKKSPGAVGLILIVGAIGGWLLAWWFCQDRIAVMQLQIEALERGAGIVREPRAPVWPVAILAAAVATSVVSAWSYKRANKLRSQIAKLLNEQDTAKLELREVRRDFAHKWVQLYSGLKFEGDLKPEVKIRFVGHGSDHKLVQEIQAALSETGWPVTVDGSNNPALAPMDKYKVIFESGWAGQFDRLAQAFVQGDLLGVRIKTEHGDRSDQHRLVILVLPSGA